MICGRHVFVHAAILLRDLIKTSLLQYDVQPKPLLIVAVELADSRFRPAAAFHALSNAHLCFAVSPII